MSKESQCHKTLDSTKINSRSTKPNLSIRPAKRSRCPESFLLYFLLIKCRDLVKPYYDSGTMEYSIDHDHPHVSFERNSVNAITPHLLSDSFSAYSISRPGFNRIPDPTIQKDTLKYPYFKNLPIKLVKNELCTGTPDDERLCRQAIPKSSFTHFFIPSFALCRIFSTVHISHRVNIVFADKKTDPISLSLPPLLPFFRIVHKWEKKDNVNLSD